MAHRNCCDYGSCDECKLDAYIEERAELLLAERGLAETRPEVCSTADVINGWRAEWNRGEAASLEDDEAEMRLDVAAYGGPGR